MDQNKNQKSVSFQINNTPKDTSKIGFQSFGQQPQSNQQSFGQQPQSNQQSFGQQPQSNQQSFGQQPQSSQQSTFAFGSSNPNKTSNNQNPSFGFGNANNQGSSQITPSQFSFGTNQPQVASQSGFSVANSNSTSAAKTPQPTGFNFNTTSNNQPPKISGFGQQQNSATTVGTTFGQQQSKPEFGQKPAITGFGQQPSATTGFGKSTQPSSQTTLGFGQTSNNSGFEHQAVTQSTNQQAATQAKPAFNFGTKNTTQVSTTPSQSTNQVLATQPSSFKFAAQPTNQATGLATVPNTENTQSSQPAAQGFSFGKTAAPAVTTSTSDPTTVNAPASFSFAAKSDKEKPSVDKPEVSAPTAKKVNFAPITSTDFNTPVSKPKDQPLQSLLLDTPQQQGMSSLMNTNNIERNTLDQIVQQWNHGLLQHKKQFHYTCELIRQFDQQLVTSHKMIYSVDQTLKKVKQSESKIETDLSYLEGEQIALVKQIEHYDQLVDQLLKEQGIEVKDGELGGNIQQQDTQRYQGLCVINESICKMNELQTAVDASHLQINELGELKDPMQLITMILSEHLNSLQDLDKQCHLLDKQVKQVKMMQEKVSFRDADMF
eukprot:NODE_229_length_13800_cov_0.838114.p1 type:complete len:601 gc:universal NODE_229_length_13800_cov_0.838114:11509-13311(+)